MAHAAESRRRCKGEDCGTPGHSFIDDWMAVSEESARSRDRLSPEDPQRALELEGVKVSLQNLRSFPFSREREAEGTLKLTALSSHLEGVLHVLDEESGTFAPV
jgi:carbonic anhydrase